MSELSGKVALRLRSLSSSSSTSASAALKEPGKQLYEGKKLRVHPYRIPFKNPGKYTQYPSFSRDHEGFAFILCRLPSFILEML
jgi:hypothetical protein